MEFEQVPGESKAMAIHVYQQTIYDANEILWSDGATQVEKLKALDRRMVAQERLDKLFGHEVHGNPPVQSPKLFADMPDENAASDQSLDPVALPPGATPAMGIPPTVQDRAGGAP